MTDDSSLSTRSTTNSPIRDGTSLLIDYLSSIYRTFFPRVRKMSSSDYPPICPICKSEMEFLHHRVWTCGETFWSVYPDSRDPTGTRGTNQ